MGYAINYGAAPNAGETIEWSGQRYEVMRAASVTTRRGTPYGQIDWLTHCADCGGAVRLTTGLKRPWLQRRCAKCDPEGFRDQIDRKAYTSAARLDRMDEGKRKKAETAAAAPIAVKPAPAATAAPKCVKVDDLAIPLEDDGTPSPYYLEGYATFADGERARFLSDGDSVFMEGSRPAHTAAVRDLAGAELADTFALFFG